jgi:NAD(P)-dependent dehydrogenase (short-subunit alcohol dehydrogenase family)
MNGKAIVILGALSGIGEATAREHAVRGDRLVLVARNNERLGLLKAPQGWGLEGLPDGVEIRRDLRGRRDVTVAFVRSRRVLERNADRYARGLDDDASLWLAWPRKAAGHDSDVTEDGLRAALLPRGLVDVKVAAIDHDWSGLKFVRRKELRGR